MAMITNDWLTALGGEFHKPYYRQLFEFVKNEYDTTVVFPPADDIFNAFHLTPLSKVKVVIIGQDPYHNVGQAHGLCFSVKPDVEIPPSLVNIYQELHDDLGCYIPNNGYLVKWAEQGVLMLNTVLTVRAHMANSHHGKGWEEFTDAAIRVLNEQDRPMVFMLWGRPWKSFAEKRNGSGFYIRIFSGFCSDVPENRKNTDIRICQWFRRKSKSWKTDIG